MGKSKILFLVPCWRRPAITELCFAGLSRLREHRDNIEVLAIISEDSMQPLCKAYEIGTTFFKNQPLGAKKNHGLQVALDMDWDYLMEVNSDDLILNHWIDWLDRVNYDYVGMMDFIWVHSKTFEARYRWDRTLYAIGRRYSRAAVEKAAGKERELWDNEASRGMDNYSNFKFEDIGLRGFRKLNPDPWGAGFKSDTNIWPWNGNIGTNYDFENFRVYLSDKENQILDNGFSN